MSPDRLLIALDYDRTYTRDPQMWNALVQMMQLRGHEVAIVTARYEHEMSTQIPAGVMVYCTGRLAKRQWTESHGMSVDIWIDDDPIHILSDAV